MDQTIISPELAASSSLKAAVTKFWLQIALLLLFVGGCAGVIAGYARWHRPAGDPFEQPRAIILNRAKDMPNGGVVIFGDSTVERQRFDNLCGLPVLNAGIGSAKAQDLLPIVEQVLNLTSPRIVVIGVGANDFSVTAKKPGETFEAAIRTILSSAQVYPIVVGVSAETPERVPHVKKANRFLVQVSAAHRGRFVEPIEPELTEDGLHLNKLGLVEWKRRVNAACPRSP